MLKCRLISFSLLFLLSGLVLWAQVPASPKRFEIYYESGEGDPASKTVLPGHFDAFDSEKKERIYDAQGGQVRYPAAWTAEESSTIYTAVLRNNILAGKKDFTDNVGSDPFMVGRLRLDIDGQITEFRFARFYGMVHRGDADWTRFQTVFTVIESILNARDQKQNLPPHKGYK